MVLEFYLTVRTNKFSPLSPPNLVLNVPIPPNQTASAFLTNKSATFPTSPNPTVLCQLRRRGTGAVRRVCDNESSLPPPSIPVPFLTLPSPLPSPLTQTP